MKKTFLLLAFSILTSVLFAQKKEEADKLFNGLSAGGKVTMPMSDSFWGAYIGMCVDKFGINWMINYDANQK